MYQLLGCAAKYSCSGWLLATPFLNLPSPNAQGKTKGYLVLLWGSEVLPLFCWSRAIGGQLALYNMLCIE